MCLTLIFTGEVQVDIRLLISFKSKECFKRDIKTVLDQLFAAVRTNRNNFKNIFYFVITIWRRRCFILT